MSNQKKTQDSLPQSPSNSIETDNSCGFDLIRPICCGVDVHKKQIVAAICTTNPATLVARYKFRSFLTTNIAIQSFVDFLKAHSCTDVCMESTGKYWIPVFNILEKAGINVILTHPKYVKAIKGKKTDKKDARWIANLFRFDLVKNSFIPPSRIRALRELSRYRLKLTSTLHGEKNRFQNSMTMSNLRLDCVFTDPFGSSATRIMNYLMSDEPFDEQKCLDMVHKKCKASNQEILDSIRGYHIHPEQFQKMTECKAHMSEIEKHIQQIEHHMSALAEPYTEQIKRLSEIPGITTLSAKMIIAEIGADMSVFETDKHLASWAGLAPANNESADKKKSTRCGKGGAYLKPLMIQCANAAVKSTKQPYFANKYKALRKRKNHKKAIVAIARMLLVSIYFMLKRNESFKPVDLSKVIEGPTNKEKPVEKNQVLKYLAEHGITAEEISALEKSLTA